jgi:hypothetical protein
MWQYRQIPRPLAAGQFIRKEHPGVHSGVKYNYLPRGEGLGIGHMNDIFLPYPNTSDFSPGSFIQKEFPDACIVGQSCGTEQYTSHPMIVIFYAYRPGNYPAKCDLAAI